MSPILPILRRPVTWLLQTDIRDETPSALPAPRPATIASLAALFGLAFITLRLSASATLGVDDAIEAVQTQVLQAGYSLRQPPLYDWLLWLVQRLTGPGLAAALLLKAAIVAAAGGFLFAAARYAIRDTRIAAVAVLSYVMIYQLGWNALEGVTHSLLVLCACAAAAWAFARIVARGAWADYLAFGLAAGLGALSKFNEILFVLPLLAAAVSDRRVRERLDPARLVAALGVAVVITAPYGLWVMLGDRPLFGQAAGVLTDGHRLSYPVRAVHAGLGAVLAMIGFALPFAAIVLVTCWRPLVRRPGTETDTRWLIERLFGRTTLLAMALTLLGGIATGAVYTKARHMHPVFAVAPLWLFARLERAGASPERFRRLAQVAAALMLATLLVRGAGYLDPPHLCGTRCRSMVPYDALARTLEGLGAGDGTLVGLDATTAGNLRVRLRQARVVVPDANLARPPPRTVSACWVVWEGDKRGAVPFEEAVNDAGAASQQWVAAGPDQVVRAAWPGLAGHLFTRATTWTLRPLDPASPPCG